MKLAQLHEDANPWHPQAMSSEQIVEWCETHAKSFLSKGCPIFRGTGPHLTGVLDTSKLNRSAAFSANGYYNWWIDNTEMWSDFPKRSQSVIATTNARTAHNYSDGIVYLIIPRDDAKIGICPQSDIWGSFSKVAFCDDVNSFGELIAYVVDGGRPKTWEQFKIRTQRTALEDVILKHDETSSGVLAEEIENLIHIWKKERVDTLYDLLEEVLDPYENHFRVETATNFGHHSDKELWVSGIEMQIETNRVDDTLTEFLDKHFDNWKL